MVQQTSLEAYAAAKVNLNYKQQQVLAVLEKHGTLSDIGIASVLGWTINRVTPRRGELVKLGLIKEAGTITGRFNRNLLVWQSVAGATANPEPYQVPAVAITVNDTVIDFTNPAALLTTLKKGYDVARVLAGDRHNTAPAFTETVHQLALRVADAYADLLKAIPESKNRNPIN